jgi:hypothetical protein
MLLDHTHPLAGRTIIFKGGNKQFFTEKRLFFMTFFSNSQLKKNFRGVIAPLPAPPSWPADAPTHPHLEKGH